ncbi:MAG: long-chain fatty acid--CoA ligase [Acidobacteriota bacterium]|nr:long-chain fatty acid--CoA ligase [Acidobacteriota bacterium]
MNQTITYADKPWLKNYDEGVPATLDYERVTLVDAFEETVKNYPERTAFIFQGYKMNYRQFGDAVNRTAAALTNFGIGKGDAAAIILPNVIPAAVCFYAILKVGGIVVMNNPLYSDRELHHQLNDSGSKLLITLDLLADRMIDLRPKTGVKQIIVTGIGDYLPFPKNILFQLFGKKKGLKADVKPAEDVYRFKSLLRQHAPLIEPEPLTFDDIAVYQYTGGTTGVSKGVMLSHGNLGTQVQQMDAWIQGHDSETYELMIGALPLFHVYGLTCLLAMSVSAGWGLVLVPKPQPDQLMEAIRKYKPTFLSLVPTMYIGLLNHPDIDKVDMRFVKRCFSGSAPLAVEVMKDFEERTNAYVSEGFGMTEASPATHTNPFDGLRKPGSIGVPLIDTEARIVDLETGTKDVPVGEEGELIIRGPQVMQGYLNRPEETANTLRDGWLYSGDIAKMDEDGYFYIVDRKKDMILSGGFNVYPREIDEVLFENPKVQEACAVGISHPTRGEQIKAFIVLREGETATPDEIIAYCREKLAVYKLPTMVEFRDELPKSTVGKVLRKELRKQEEAKAS